MLLGSLWGSVGDKPALHILVVDDEALVGLAILDILEGEGYRVTAVLGGEQALALDATDPADLLLTDMMMPRMSGAELILEIRQRRPALPVIVLSGYMTDNLAARLGEIDPASVTLLAKPVPMTRLIEAVKTACCPLGPQST